MKRGTYGLVVLNGLLGWGLIQPAPILTVHPLVPALTRVAALGDHPLAVGPDRRTFRIAVEKAIARVGSPAQHQQVSDLRRSARGLDVVRSRGMVLRVALEVDAITMAQVLGPERVQAIVAHKDTLSTTVGEGTVWTAR